MAYVTSKMTKTRKTYKARMAERRALLRTFWKPPPSQRALYANRELRPLPAAEVEDPQSAYTRRIGGRLFGMSSWEAPFDTSAFSAAVSDLASDEGRAGQGSFGESFFFWSGFASIQTCIRYP